MKGSDPTAWRLLSDAANRNAMLYRATDLIYDVEVVLAENFDK